MDYRAVYTRLFKEMSTTRHREVAVRAAEHAAYAQLKAQHERCVSLARHYESLATRRVQVEERVPVVRTAVIWQMRPLTVHVREPYRIRAGWGWITLWRTVRRTVYVPVPVLTRSVVWVTTTRWVTERDPEMAAKAAANRRCAERTAAELSERFAEVTARRNAWNARWASLNRAAHEAWRAFNTTCQTIRQAGNARVQECSYDEWRNYSPGLFERTILGASPRPPDQLVRQARDQITPPGPVIRLNPKAEWEQIVHLPTWMWVEPGVWRPHTARADAGESWAEATAVPERVVWDMGNGDRVTCEGPGAAYDDGRHESVQRTDCSYTYRQSSAGRPGDAYTVTATIVYDVTWHGSGDAGGDLGTISRSSTARVRVAELQALVDRAG